MSTPKTLRELLVPAYLFLCIVLGGSAQAIWGNLVLQLLGLLMIGYAAVRPSKQKPTSRFRTLAVIAITALALIALQLLPLPPEMWTRLPGRAVLARGYEDMGQQLPWLPVSMAPVQTLSCAIFLIPPFAILIGVVLLDACRTRWAIAAILLATILSVMLGYVQVSSNSSKWYLYEDTNLGSAVGFFANRNHMGTLLLISIPMIALFLSAGTSADRRRSTAILLAGGSCGVIVLAGIAMNGSLAALVLAVPVTTASILLFRSTRRFRTAAMIVCVCAFMIGLAVLASSPVQGKLSGADTSSITGRWEIWTTSVHAAAAAFPIGTGFGSFLQVYHLFEDPSKVTDTYVIHAHNDYVELLLEGGIPAVLLIGAFIIWWVAAVRAAWSTGRDMTARAATIASAAILGHSIFDYPLRTTAIAAVFAFCVGLISKPYRASAETASAPLFSQDIRPTRHVTIA